MEITVTGPSGERRDTRVHIKKGEKKRAQSKVTSRLGAGERPAQALRKEKLPRPLLQGQTHKPPKNLLLGSLSTLSLAARSLIGLSQQMSGWSIDG